MFTYPLERNGFHVFLIFAVESSIRKFRLEEKIFLTHELEFLVGAIICFGH